MFYHFMQQFKIELQISEILFSFNAALTNPFIGSAD